MTAPGLAVAFVLPGVHITKREDEISKRGHVVKMMSLPSSHLIVLTYAWILLGT